MAYYGERSGGHLCKKTQLEVQGQQKPQVVPKGLLAKVSKVTAVIMHNVCVCVFSMSMVGLRQGQV